MSPELSNVTSCRALIPAACPSLLRPATYPGSVTTEEPRPTAAAWVLMTLVLLWSGALAALFTVSAATGRGGISDTRRLAFALIALFLSLLAVRTGYELVRRLLLLRGTSVPRVTRR